MPRAELTLEIPDGVWIGTITRSYPDLRVRVLGAIVASGTGFVVAAVSGTKVTPALDDVRGRPAVSDLTVMHDGDREALVFLDTTTPLLLGPAKRARVPVETPFTIRAGEVSWDVVASEDRLARLDDELDALGVSYSLEALRQDEDGEPLLTAVERQVIREAVEAGFYDTPRQCTLTELASRLETPKSTCCERIQRAERKIVTRFLERSERRFGWDSP